MFFFRDFHPGSPVARWMVPLPGHGFLRNHTLHLPGVVRWDLGVVLRVELLCAMDFDPLVIYRQTDRQVIVSVESGFNERVDTSWMHVDANHIGSDYVEKSWWTG